MNDVCLECDCAAVYVTAWGDWLCAWHMDHGPTTSLTCPTCSLDVTPAGLPGAAVDDRSSDADAAAPPAASAPISPVVVIPPAATTGDPAVSGADFARHGLASTDAAGESLDDMLQALEWCVTRAYDDDSASRVVVGTAERALIVFGNVIKAVSL